jgi:hypothetical protein
MSLIKNKAANVCNLGKRVVALPKEGPIIIHCDTDKGRINGCLGS